MQRVLQLGCKRNGQPPQSDGWLLDRFVRQHRFISVTGASLGTVRMHAS